MALNLDPQVVSTIVAVASRPSGATLKDVMRAYPGATDRRSVHRWLSVMVTAGTLRVDKSSKASRYFLNPGANGQLAAPGSVAPTSDVHIAAADVSTSHPAADVPKAPVSTLAGKVPSSENPAILKPHVDTNVTNSDTGSATSGGPDVHIVGSNVHIGKMARYSGNAARPENLATTPAHVDTQGAADVHIPAQPVHIDAGVVSTSSGDAALPDTPASKHAGKVHISENVVTTQSHVDTNVDKGRATPVHMDSTGVSTSAEDGQLPAGAVSTSAGKVPSPENPDILKPDVDKQGHTTGTGSHSGTSVKADTDVHITGAKVHIAKMSGFPGKRAHPKNVDTTPSHVDNPPAANVHIEPGVVSTSAGKSPAPGNVDTAHAHVDTDVDRPRADDVHIGPKAVSTSSKPQRNRRKRGGGNEEPTDPTAKLLATLAKTNPGSSTEPDLKSLAVALANWVSQWLPVSARPLVKPGLLFVAAVLGYQLIPIIRNHGWITLGVVAVLTFGAAVFTKLSRKPESRSADPQPEPSAAPSAPPSMSAPVPTSGPAAAAESGPVLQASPLDLQHSPPALPCGLPTVGLSGPADSATLAPRRVRSLIAGSSAVLIGAILAAGWYWSVRQRPSAAPAVERLDSKTVHATANIEHPTSNVEAGAQKEAGQPSQSKQETTNPGTNAIRVPQDQNPNVSAADSGSVLQPSTLDLQHSASALPSGPPASPPSVIGRPSSEAGTQALETSGPPTAAGAYARTSSGAWVPLPRNNGKINFTDPDVLIAAINKAVKRAAAKTASKSPPDVVGELRFDGKEIPPTVSGSTVEIAFVGEVPTVPADVLEEYPALKTTPLVEVAPLTTAKDGTRSVPIVLIAPDFVGFGPSRVAATLTHPSPGVTLLSFGVGQISADISQPSASGIGPSGIQVFRSSGTSASPPSAVSPLPSDSGPPAFGSSGPRLAYALLCNHEAWELIIE